MYILINWRLFMIYRIRLYNIIIIDHCSGVAHHYTTPCYSINYCFLQEKVSSLSNYYLVDDAILFMTFVEY